MPTASTIKSYRNFTGGLVTDALSIAELDNSVTDIRNMIIEKSGRLSRAAWSKDATAYETTETFSSITSDDKKIDTYVWKTPNGDATVNILVVRIGSDLYFFDLDINGTTTPYVLEDNFIEKLTTTGLGDSRDIQFTEGKGVLFYCGLDSAITYVSYDSGGSPKFTENTVSMFVRDIDGEDVAGVTLRNGSNSFNSLVIRLTNASGNFVSGETLTIGAGPETMTMTTDGTLIDNTNRVYTVLDGAFPFEFDLDGPVYTLITGVTSGASGRIRQWLPGYPTWPYYYNYLNSGWQPDIFLQYQYSGQEGTVPEEGAQWFSGKDSNGDFDPDELIKTFFGNTIAPRAALIWEVDRTDDSPAKTLSYFRGDLDPFDIFLQVAPNYDYGDGELTSSVSFNPSSNVFTQGRLFCSGSNESSKDHNIIYVSQIVRDNLSNVGAFHQEQDPTAEVFNDSLDTDGFVIRIDDAINIKHMVPYGVGILAFAENGVWQLSSDTVLTPTNLSVRKVTDRGCSSPDSVVSAADSIYYFSDDRLMSILPDPNTGFLVQRDLSSNIIGDLYTGSSDITAFNMTSEDRDNAYGAFDELNNRIYWLYKSSRSGIEETRNKVLVLDLSLGAYYLLDAPGSSGEAIAMYSRLKDKLYFLNLEEISDVNLDLQFLASKLDTFLDRDDDSYSATNTYFETFEETVGDPTRKKRAPWVISYMDRTEQNYIDDGSGGIIFDDPSGCLMRVKWDWTDSATANKWSDQFQVYRFLRPFIVPSTPQAFDYSYDVIVTKNKIRGVGRALRFRFDAEEDKNMKVLGWDVNYLAGGNI